MDETLQVLWAKRITAYQASGQMQEYSKNLKRYHISNVTLTAKDSEMILL